MSVLKSIEHRIESLVEGIFGRAFRTHVQPAELARKLAKEMDDHRSISVSRVYVPNEYAVYLSPGDRRQFESFEESLLTELSDYLSEHARREGYALLSTPRVVMEEDEDLAVGEFGIATKTVQPERIAEPAAAAPAPAGLPPAHPPPDSTRIYRTAPDTEAVDPGDAERLGLAYEEPAALLVAGSRHELGAGATLIGRSRECDVTLSDPNVSRRHAEVRREDGTYWVVDLGSTNGIEVNGRRTERARLEDGARIVLGETEIVFERRP